jgi:hypothetical protein
MSHARRVAAAATVIILLKRETCLKKCGLGSGLEEEKKVFIPLFLFPTFL